MLLFFHLRSYSETKIDLTFIIQRNMVQKAPPHDICTLISVNSSTDDFAVTIRKYLLNFIVIHVL